MAKARRESRITVARIKTIKIESWPDVQHYRTAAQVPCRWDGLITPIAEAEPSSTVSPWRVCPFWSINNGSADWTPVPFLLLLPGVDPSEQEGGDFPPGASSGRRNVVE